MATTGVLGPREDLTTTVPIASDADFTFAVRSTGADFPDGARLELRIRTREGEQIATWAGTRDPDNPKRMLWNVDQALVAAMLADGKPRTVRVHYVHDEVNLLWVVWAARVI